MMSGAHCVTTWSKTGSIIARRSADSELYGMIKGGCDGLGMRALCEDQREEVDIQLHVDALAAKGIVERKGLSNVRHIDLDHLRMQEQQARKLLPLVKVKGAENPGDLTTKHVPVGDMLKYL